MRVAVIGIGAIGPIHISGLINRGQEIVALCDICEERCRQANVEFGLSASVYTDYKAMLSEVKLDAVHICTPHYLHAEMICEALGKGIHVLCEKPLAISFEQLDQIEKAVQSSSAQLGICFQNRYNASVLYVKEFFKDKEITAASANLIWCRDEEYYASGAWRGTKEQEGGGVMINQAIHALDVLQWLCGMPETVLAHVSNNSLQGIIDVEDTATLFCEGDTKFTFFATNTGGADMPTEIRLTLSNGENVVAYPDKLYVNGKMVTEEDMRFVLGKCCYGNGHEKLIADFYNCIKHGQPFSMDGKEASKVVKMIFAAYESNGEKINIKG